MCYLYLTEILPARGGFYDNIGLTLLALFITYASLYNYFRSMFRPPHPALRLSSQSQHVVATEAKCFKCTGTHQLFISYLIISVRCFHPSELVVWQAYFPNLLAHITAIIVIAVWCASVRHQTSSLHSDCREYDHYDATLLYDVTFQITTAIG
jgi:hypothetical protein